MFNHDRWIKNKDKDKAKHPKAEKDLFRGCLLGGAVADARGYDVLEGGKTLISDNTQMSSFTVDGLVWADQRAKRKGVYAYIPCIFYSYQKWYYTQTGNLADKDYSFILTGEILEYDELFARRGKGVTSLNALGESIHNKYGSLTNRINNSKGCGCVMRVAPIGLYFRDNPDMAFKIGCESAALTHGHSDAIVSAGYISHLIALLAGGYSAYDGILLSLRKLNESDIESPECAGLVAESVRLSKDKKILPREAIESLGEGYIAPEAIAIATYIALKYRDNFEDAVQAAIDFNGNNDSIAPIVGNIIGSIIGSLEIPAKWILELELADLIIHGADLLVTKVNE
jgi:ADP-ribosylglycohydrolase